MLFLWNLGYFSEHLFSYRTPPVAVSVLILAHGKKNNKLHEQIVGKTHLTTNIQRRTIVAKLSEALKNVFDFNVVETWKSITKETSSRLR